MQMMHQIPSVLAVEGQNDFAIAASHKWVITACIAQFLVVVNFSVDGKGNACIGVNQGLSTACDIDNRQSFMCQNGVFMLIYTAPIRSSVTLALGNLQCELAVGITC